MSNGQPQGDGGATALVGEWTLESIGAAVNVLISKADVQASEYQVVHRGMVEHAARLQSLEDKFHSLMDRLDSLTLSGNRPEGGEVAEGSVDIEPLAHSSGDNQPEPKFNALASELVEKRNKARNETVLSQTDQSGRDQVSAGRGSSLLRREGQGSDKIYEVQNTTDSLLVVKDWERVIMLNEMDPSVHNKSMMKPVHGSITVTGRNALNVLNCFEASIEEDDAEWLQTLPIIKSRDTVLSNNETPARQNELASKMDNLFLQQMPAFMKSDKYQFHSYIERFWEVGVRHFVNGGNFVKSQLFHQINQVYPEVCSEDLRPGAKDMKNLTLKAYIIQLKLKFQPSNQKEISKAFFEKYAQGKKNIDIYFDEKLRLFYVAYGRRPTEMDYHEFFRHFLRNMESRKLARMMADERRHLDKKKPDLVYYKNQMLASAQQILDGYNDGYYKLEDARGCKSLSYSGLSKNLKQTSRGYHKGGAHNPITIAQLEKPTSDSEFSDIYVSDEPDEDEEDQGIEEDTDEERIMVLNERKGAQEMKCFYCGKLGHTMRTCWDRQGGKPPHPLGVYAKRMKETKDTDPPRRPTRKPVVNQRKGLQKGTRNKIQQLDDGQNDQEDIPMSQDTVGFLNSIHDLGYLPSPLNYESGF